VIEVMAQSAGNILGFRATGRLSQADYREVLEPCVRSLLERFETLKVLFLTDEPFDGWSPTAAWTNTMFDLKHRRDFDKVAVVGAPKWEEWCVKAAARLLMSGEMRTFRRDELARAWEWVRT